MFTPSADCRGLAGIEDQPKLELLPILLLELVQLGLVVPLVVLADPAVHLTLSAAVPMLLVSVHRTFLVMIFGVLHLRVETLVTQLDICGNLQPGSHVHVDELKGEPVT